MRATRSVPPPLARSEAEHLKALIRQSAERKASATFVIEGPHLLERALERVPSHIRTAYFTHEALESQADLVSAVYKKKINVVAMSAKQSESISDTKSPQGVFALMAIKTDTSKTGTDHIIALDAVQDPGNVGTIIRTAAWFGIEQIILGEGSADPYSSKTLRASQGEIFSVQCETTDDLSLTLSTLKKKGHKILATTLSREAGSLYREDFSGKIVIVLGSEAHGVSKAVSGVADREITIPKIGNGESLNVAMSSAIILSEIAARTSRKIN